MSLHQQTRRWLTPTKVFYIEIIGADWHLHRLPGCACIFLSGIHKQKRGGAETNNGTFREVFSMNWAAGVADSHFNTPPLHTRWFLREPLCILGEGYNWKDGLCAKIKRNLSGWSRLLRISSLFRRYQLKLKKKELVKYLRQYLNLSERDASDKDLLECFGHTNLSAMENLPIRSSTSFSCLNNPIFCHIE